MKRDRETLGERQINIGRETVDSSNTKEENERHEEIQKDMKRDRETLQERQLKVFFKDKGRKGEK